MSNFKLAPSILVLFLLLSSGCSTTQTFSHTPISNQDFTKSFSTLKQEYSDIEKFDRTFGSPASAPPKQSLEELWGPPNKTKKHWLNYLWGLGLGAGLTYAGLITAPLFGVVVLITPTPYKEYIWQKGNYEITVKGRSDIFVKYEDHIHSWKWKNLKNKE
jgi:hypothetical protein